MFRSAEESLSAYGCMGVDSKKVRAFLLRVGQLVSERENISHLDDTF